MPDERNIEAAAEAARRGQLVIFPTETFYGLGTRAEDPVAVARVVTAKGRKPGSPFPLIAADVGQVESLCTAIPADARKLMETFWPGPLTLVLPARPGLPEEVAGSGSVGVRVSPNEWARDLARRCGPLVATSANLSGEPEATRVADLSPAIVATAEVVIDGGVTPGGRPSTVIAWVGGDWRLIRPGQVPPERILGALGRKAFGDPGI